MMRTGYGLIAVWLLCAGLAAAALVEDQVQEKGYTALLIGTNPDVPSWQQFTPTLDNLAQIGFRFYGADSTGYGDINIVLKDADDVTLWTGSIDESSIQTNVATQWTIVPIDTPVPLVPEQTYKLQLYSSPSERQFQWLGSKESPYDRGASDYFFENFDYVFKTWAVPEPLTLSLFGLGIFYLDRRRRLLRK